MNINCSLCGKDSYGLAFRGGNVCYSCMNLVKELDSTTLNYNSNIIKTHKLNNRMKSITYKTNYNLKLINRQTINSK